MQWFGWWFVSGLVWIVLRIQRSFQMCFGLQFVCIICWLRRSCVWFCCGMWFIRKFFVFLGLGVIIGWGNFRMRFEIGVGGMLLGIQGVFGCFSLIWIVFYYFWFCFLGFGVFCVLLMVLLVGVKGVFCDLLIVLFFWLVIWKLVSF